MKYRLVLCILFLAAVITAPVSANLRKIDAGTPVFIGETGIDISSGLNGCREIAWWPVGNATDTPPGKILGITGDIYNYTFSTAIFSNYPGIWYSWDKKPSIPVFEVLKPEFDLTVWDLDKNRDVTGQTVPRSTRITYRIDTNLYPVFNKYKRPEINNLDSFMNVELTGPNGNVINSIYTGSAGLSDTLVLNVDTNPKVRSSPYYWKDGGRWNHTARSGDGAVLYPPGTYTFVGTQNLNDMRIFYNETIGVTTSGKKTITFTADVQETPSPVITPTTESTPVTPSTTATVQKTPSPGPSVVTTPVGKPTWTSTPLPLELTLAAVFIACLGFLGGHRRSS